MDNLSPISTDIGSNNEIGAITNEGDYSTRRYEHRYPMSFEVVWKTLTYPIELAVFFNTTATIDIHLSGTISLSLFSARLGFLNHDDLQISKSASPLKDAWAK
jgi:hypothetical protein